MGMGDVVNGILNYNDVEPSEVKVSKRTDTLLGQLRRLRSLTGANWTVYLIQSVEGWQVVFAEGLEGAPLSVLQEFLKLSSTQKWLDSALGSDRTRHRALKHRANVLGCERVFVFAGQSSPGIIMVGANELDKRSEESYKIMALDLPSVDMDLMPEALSEVVASGSWQLSADLNSNLQTILQTLLQVIEAELACLAVREGEGFTVEAVVGFSSDILNSIVQIADAVELEDMVETQRGALLTAGESEKLAALFGQGGKEYSWLLAPIRLGKRVTGMLVFGRGTGFDEDDLVCAMKLGNHIAPAVDKTIAFVQASNYLQRMALVNELASVTSVGVELPEFIRRVKRMIQRAFPVDRVSLFFLESDGQMMYEISSMEEEGKDWLPVKSSMEGSVLKVGQVVRIDNIAKQSKYSSADPQVQSKLVVPLWYQGEVNGVLSLESRVEDAFNSQDEQLAVVIASQIAGIIEHMRLNAETRLRAHNLQQINEIVQRAVGVNRVSAISQMVAEMMSERFGYEMVLVMLLDERLNELVAEGVAGSSTKGFPRGLRYASSLGIPGEVLEYGESILLKDVSDNPSYMPIPGWALGAEMCVPMKDEEKVFGVINVEYQKPYAIDESDLLVLEALAAVFSSVLIYARRYEEMERNLRQLEAVRETALDISADLDLDQLLARAVKRVRELVDARGAELGLLDRVEKKVRVLVSDNPWQDYTDYEFPLMSGITGRVAGTGEALAIADYYSWRGNKDNQFKAPFTTVAGVPLKLSGEVIGTLVVQDDRPTRAFVEEDIKVLELLTPQLAIYIRNARLYQELEERIEAQKKVEARLVRSAKLAAVGEMSAAVAHELNNPLTTVTGFAELIQEALPKDSPEYDDMTLVLQEAHRARGVVRRLLDFSRQSEVLRIDVDINELLGNVLALMHHMAQTSGVEVRVELWDELPHIRADRNQLQQVFLNLIHNALQAMPGGGQLVLRTLLQTREDGDWIAGQVEDNGQGISAENIDQIFEPFFTTKPSGEGTGLGLSVSYGIVSDHGGYIEVSSEDGVGTVFTVWLPIGQILRQESE